MSATKRKAAKGRRKKPPRKSNAGRKPLPANRKRSQALFVKLTPDEKALIVAAGGEHPSVWARDLILQAAQHVSKR